MINGLKCLVVFSKLDCHLSNTMCWADLGNPVLKSWKGVSSQHLLRNTHSGKESRSYRLRQWLTIQPHREIKCTALSAMRYSKEAETKHVSLAMKQESQSRKALTCIPSYYVSCTREQVTPWITKEWDGIPGLQPPEGQERAG